MILASGLGILEILYKFVEKHSNNNSLVFILNLSKNDIEFIKMRLMTNNNKNVEDIKDCIEFHNITHSLSASERQNIYLSGGCISITSRILVTDFLNNIIPFKSITGILINNAHQLCKSSNLSFVLEIYRRNNRRGFIKGFSDSASKFCGGYATLKSTMKQLFVSKVSIWPRFRVSVEDSFKNKSKNNEIDIVELHLKLTDSMRIIQECIMEIMNALLNELKKTSMGNLKDITIENGLFNDFEYNLYISFKPYWNKLSLKTKNLIKDLINLKRLLKYILSYDAITFYRHLLSMKKLSIDHKTNIPKSIWLFTDSAEKLFVTSKKRVFQWFSSKSNQNKSRNRKRKRSNNINHAPNKRRKLTDFKYDNIDNIDNEDDDRDDDEGELQINLEINPKWTLLINVMKEIRKLQNERQENKENKQKLTAPILIICRNKSTAKQLSQIISSGPKYLINKYWKTYLSHISHFNQIQIGNKLNDRQKEINCLLTHYSKLKEQERKQSHIDHYFSLNEMDIDIDINEDNNDKKEEEQDPFIDLTIEEKKHQQELLSAFENDNAQNNNKIYSKFNVENKINDEISDPLSPSKSRSPSISNHNNNNKKKKKNLSESEKQQFAFNDALDRLCHGLSNRNYINPNKTKIIIHAISDDDDGDNNTNLLLWQLKPEFVILYDINNLKFIRLLEIYHSYYNNRNLRIYLLSYTSSIEEQIYLSNIRREKDSFLKLINEKGDMILPNNINGKIDKNNLKLPSQQLGVINDKSKRSQIGTNNVSSIIRKKEKIIVDIREFRNSTSLPLMLYRDNINIEPVTLKVGDYILSPKLCVERKCINDLFSSIIHGRLYDQILQITRYYAIPILLIEFDEKKSFSLQNIKEIPQNINLSNIISKLAILTIHFNKLTILWSRCPLITTKLFKTLKANRPQPNKDTSVTITNNDIGDDEEDIHTPKDILRSLPGVNHKNVNKILEKCQSLKELCSKSKDEIYEMLGGKDGKLLYDFLHTNFFND